MAINLLGNMPKPKGNLLEQMPKPQGNLLSNMQPNATSVATGKPVLGSMGVAAKSPAFNAKPPQSTLPTGMSDTQRTALRDQGRNLSASGLDSSGQPKVQPVQTQSLAQKTVANPPSYDMMSGRLTDYGKSQGLGDVNAPQKQEKTPEKQPSAPPSFGGLLGQSVSQAGVINDTANKIGEQGQMTPEESIARQKLAQLTGQKGDAIANIETHPSDINFQMGREAVLNRNVQAQEQSLGQQISGYSAERAANTGAYQGQASAQQGAGGLITQAAGQIAPVQVPYSNQYINPLTGQPVGGGVSGSLQDAVSGVVQKLTSGQMSYNDALTALSGYGQGGINALQQALPQGFNIAQSNTLAGQQGSIKPAYDYAKTALSNLQTLVGQLGFSQGQNIPAVNSVGNWVSTTFGINSDKTRQYLAAVAEARNAVQKVLASAGGGTPSDYVAQSNALIPDNATPNDIQAAINNLESLGAAKVGIYGNPGQSNGGTQNGTTGNIYSW